MSLVLCANACLAWHVAAQPCATASIKPKGKDRAHVLIEAEAYGKALRFPEARAMYQWMVAHKSDDRDARYALARMDAWERCFARAGTTYRELLKNNPADLEARVGLVDILLWDGRFDDAGPIIDAGMRLEPERVELWTRRAKLLLWSGDIVGAIPAADHAERLAPEDLELRAFRDGLFHGQFKAGARGDWYQGDYPNIYSTNLQLLQRWKQVDFQLDAQLVDRVNKIVEDAPPIDQNGADRQTPLPSKAVLDGRFALGGVYRFNGEVATGLTFGYGAPAKFVPQYEARASIWVSLFTRWMASLSYSYWQYKDPKTVHIFAPSLAYSLTDTLQLEARAWISYLVLRPAPMPTQTRLAPAVGARAIWHIVQPLRLMFGYTYGPQFDTVVTTRTVQFETTANTRFLGLKSHIFALNADWMLERAWGLLPGLALEDRFAPHSVLIFSAELGAYVRW